MKLNKSKLLAVLFAVLLLPIFSFKDTATDKQVLKIHLIGVTKNATKAPTIYVETNGQKSKLKELNEVLDTIDNQLKYSMVTQELMGLIVVLKTSGYSLASHSEIDQDDPNERGLTLHFEKNKKSR